jgi:hypothetical protein
MVRRLDPGAARELQDTEFAGASASRRSGTVAAKDAPDARVKIVDALTNHYRRLYEFE